MDAPKLAAALLFSVLFVFQCPMAAQATTNDAEHKSGSICVLPNSQSRQPEFLQGASTTRSRLPFASTRDSRSTGLTNGQCLSKAWTCKEIIWSYSHQTGSESNRSASSFPK